jgi:hypothetical protein
LAFFVLGPVAVTAGADVAVIFGYGNNRRSHIPGSGLRIRRCKRCVLAFAIRATRTNAYGREPSLGFRKGADRAV